MEPARPSVDLLRAVARQQGVEPADEDLEALQAFLAVLLPQLRELEALVPPQAAS